MNESTAASRGSGADGSEGQPIDDSSSGVGLEWLSLADDESVLWAGGPDRRTVLPAASSLVLPALALVAVPFEPVAALVAAVLLALVTLPIVGWVLLQVRNTDYVVTTSGLYEKRGVLSRDVKRIDFEKVQNTAYNQSALGTWLGYGDVEVSSAGGAGVEMRFRSISNPHEIQQLISSRVTAVRASDRRNEGDTAGSSDEVLEEILAELRAIRTHLEDDATASTTHGSLANRPPDAGEGKGDEAGITFERESADTDLTE
ncbi:PH domain-containing protein [Natronolimnohabitans sp. A-GB9]|uniref:PH domain-containing protein n=1 Tax=Natronolimnohabitans sp. A-GB9 TaxID=3069757 RepID=UPI0027B5EBF4|nr:PH domain-containing protein [Natronolimnohabitans sp. A-GB9]MDQ2051442.1 PH domain-containing protein [Natronolimnohabitans sp. A-GB9]